LVYSVFKAGVGCRKVSCIRLQEIPRLEEPDLALGFLQKDDE
jgi:hypothetical protein